jgi:voltage-gated potassium channel Kch
MKKGRTRVWEILANGWKYELFFLLVIIGAICSFGINSIRMEKQYTVPDALYDTLKLFVLNADRPPQGGKWYFLYPLLVIYFIAPVITLGGIFNWINSRLHNPQRGIDKLKGHIVLGGMGKTGNAIFDMLERRGELVVPIDNDNECKYLQGCSNGKKYVIGDIAVLQTLQRANISKAKMLICMSDNDVANVDAALTAIKGSDAKSDKEPNKRSTKQPNKDLKCLIQIKDVKFEQYIMPLLIKEYRDQIKVINTYEIVAKKVLEDLKTGRDLYQNHYLFIIAGFGNFGKMMAQELFKANLVGNDKNKLVIIDHDANAKWRMFSAEHPEHKIIDNSTFFRISNDNIGNPQVWEKLKTEENDSEKLVILATDNDIDNINTALQIKRIIGDKIFVVSRLFRNVNMIEEKLSNIRGYVFSKIFLDEIQQDIFGMIGLD